MVPKGNNGTPNLSWYYDPSYLGGNLSITAYKITSDADKEYFGLGSINLNGVGNYPIYNGSNAVLSYTSLKDSCETTYYDTSIYRSGMLTITKFDTANGIISGTFYATLYTPQCDTIKITEGRFDLGDK